MRVSAVNYVLTTFSPTMFGDRASIHQMTMPIEDALALIDHSTTQIVATRASHENLAKNLFGDLRTTRFADMAPDKSAIFIHYRGAPIADDGVIREGGVVTLYLIESEEYQEYE